MARENRRRRLRFTREGKYFVALTFAAGFAAINTGNNLLYLILGMLLALIVTSGILSELSLRSLGVLRTAPRRLFANRAFLMGIGLKNSKSRLASFSIEIEDLVHGSPLDKKCYFLKVPAGRTQHTSYRHTFSRRGQYQLSGFRISTKFPFALFKKSRRCTAPLDLVVYPEVRPTLAPQRQMPLAGERQSRRRGRWGEYHGLREYREGDDPRDISWRNSAKLGRPLVREHEDPEGRRVAIFLDNRELPQMSPADLDRQEEAVSHAASLAAHYIGHSYEVSLVSRTSNIGFGSGPAHLHNLLHALALIRFVPLADQEGPLPRLPADCIVVTPRAETLVS